MLQIADRLTCRHQELVVMTQFGEQWLRAGLRPELHINHRKQWK
uniref:Uncharacterized protein n=1 Tax=Aeromonas salmonicida subsp. salmonicida TaxID=29491 RepID=A0A1I9S257_AERSS|nr:putative hypothetical protein [Aeromonas salmonicida subsp. salmonicida]